MKVRPKIKIPFKRKEKSDQIGKYAKIIYTKSFYIHRTFTNYYE